MIMNLSHFIKKNLPLVLFFFLSGLLANSANSQTPFLVKNINTKPISFGSSPRNFVHIGSTTYFTAYTLAEGAELWKTDGIPGGATDKNRTPQLHSLKRIA